MSINNGRVFPNVMPQHVAAKQREYTQRNSPTMRKARYMGLSNPAKLSAAAGALVSVAEYAERASKQSTDFYFKVMADPTATEAARLVRSAKHARELMGGVQQAWKTALDGMEARMEALSASRARAMKITDAGTAILDGQLRDHLRHQPGDVMLNLIKSDPAFARAVATAPAVLTGAAESTHLLAQREHFRHTCPDEAAEYDDLSQCFEIGKAAMEALEADVGEVIDFDEAERYQSAVAMPAAA